MSRSIGSERLGKWGGPALIAVALVVLPLVLTGSYLHSVLAQGCIYLLLLTGLNVITGYGGQVSLAHAGLYGLGAYTAGVTSATWGWPTLLALVAAPVVVTATTAAVGAVTLRLRGLYFVMATLGTGVVLFLLFGRATGLTGGPNGLLGIPPLTLGGLELTTTTQVYWVCAACALAGVVVAQVLAASRLGFSLRAADASEPAAAAIGVSVFGVRLVAFVVSGAMAGLAGGLSAFQTQFVSPDPFNFLQGVLLLVALTIGGAGTTLGPALGAALLVALNEGLSGLSDYEPLIFGVIFLFAIQLLPDGVVGAAGRLLGRRRREGSPT